jgi:ADP-ribose pyrophosphatase
MKMSKIQIQSVTNLNEEILQFSRLHKNDPDFDEKFEAFLKQKSRWLKLFNVQYQLENGKTGVWTFASRKASPNPGQPLAADAVVIIPLYKDGPVTKLVTIREYRIPLGFYEHGFPAGLYDHNETAEQVARRELKEETGLDLTKVLHISPPVVSSAGLSDESVVYIVCECTGNISTAGNEGTEDITVNILDKYGVAELLANSRTLGGGNAISAKAYPFLYSFINEHWSEGDDAY